MTFTPQPESHSEARSPAWVKGPIETHDYAELLDLFVDDEDRNRRSLCLLVLDAGKHLVQPIVVNDLPAPAPCPTEFLEGLAAHLHDGDFRVLVAYARPGALRLTGEDLRWQAYVSDAFGALLLGCYLVVPDAVRAYADCPIAA